MIHPNPPATQTSAPAPHRALAFAPAVFGLALSLACSASASLSTGSSRPNQPPPPNYVAKVVIADLQADAEERVEQYLRDRGYQNVQIGHEKGQAVLVFETDRHVAQVERDLARIEQPALQIVRRGYVVEYQAVDNLPPEIKIIYPETDGSTVVTEQPVAITVEVPAPDTAQVLIGGREAERVGNSVVYRAEVPLTEGENRIEVKALDEMGNAGLETAILTLDTTAPAVAARIKIVVEGEVEPGSTVLINGQTVAVDDDGRYEHEVSIRSGQKEIEIVAIDKNGNKTTEMKSLGL